MATLYDDDNGDAVRLYGRRERKRGKRMRPGTKERAILAGALVGALLMGVFLAVVLRYGAGALGMLLMVLLILIAGAGGWMLGYQNRSRDRKKDAYQRGYEAGQRDAGITIIPNPDTKMSFGFRKLY